MRPLIALLACSLLTPALRAQDSTAALPANMLRLPGGGTMEFLGLERWTPQEIRDTVKKYDGEDIVEDAHACGAVLRYKVHFADAASIFYKDAAGQTSFIVTVTEPQDSSRIIHHFLALDTTGGRPDWQTLREYAHHQGGALRDVMMTMLGKDSTTPVPLKTAADTTAWHAFRTFFAVHKAKADQRLAIAVLQSDSNYLDRQIAVVMMLNFGTDDSTWSALSQTMLESDGVVQGDAVLAMRLLVQAGDKPAHLAAIEPAFHAVLDGTSEFEMFSAVPLLSSLKPDSTQAKPLLQNGGHMLIAYAGSHFAPFQNMALQLLRQLSGQDFGTDTTKWSNWIAKLS